MEKEIVLKGQVVSYTLRQSTRAKRVNVTLHRDGTVVVSLPKRTAQKEAEDFLRKKEKWVLSHLKKVENDKNIYLPDHKGGELDFLKEYASLFIRRKVDVLNKHYNFRINKISIKNQKTQWGSCSVRKNLNFTYKLVLLPCELAEYIVVHELCHLKEFSHNADFWNLVAETVPDYKQMNKELLRYHLR